MAGIWQQAELDLQKTLNELKRRDVWIAQILGVIREGIVTLDDHGHVTFFSRRAELITGWYQADVLGRSCDEIFSPAEGSERFSQLLPLPGEGRKFAVSTSEQRYITLHIDRMQLRLADEDATETVLILRDENEEYNTPRKLDHMLKCKTVN